MKGRVTMIECTSTKISFQVFLYDGELSEYVLLYARPPTSVHLRSCRGRLLPRQIGPQPPWTALPQTLTCTSLSGLPLTPTPSCSGTYTTYGLDATWTVIATKAVVTPSSRSLPVHTATVLAVQTAGTTYWPPPAPTVKVNQRVRITLVNKLDTPHAEKSPLTFMVSCKIRATFPWMASKA
jgi:hypothetical protein